jgi:hypothetical protein
MNRLNQHPVPAYPYHSMWPSRWEPDKKPCVRCGCWYTPRSRKVALCRDCRKVVPVEEQETRWLT